MDLSFVILSWNSARYLRECVNSISSAMAATEFSYEILILDNGSQDGSAALLAQLESVDSHVVVSYQATNLGTTKSRNILLNMAKGEYVCVMDSDVELSIGTVEALIPYLSSRREVGLVVPRIVYPSDAWQKSFDVFPTLLDKINRFFNLREIEAEQAAMITAAAQPFHIDYAISAFWLMRKELLSRVGLLDEKIFYAPEDVDFCLRVWKSGHQIVYVPSVTVIHHTQEISRGFKINKAKLSHIKGLMYYFRKHQYLFRRPTFASNAPIDVDIRAIKKTAT